MNSSGIKRGLATTAVTALAIAGLPLIAASPASADVGDELLTELITESWLSRASKRAVQAFLAERDGA